MSELTCKSALKLESILRSADTAVLDQVLTATSPEELATELNRLGIELQSCDRQQILKVVRDRITSVSDEDLLKAAGGEIAKTTKAVVTATAVAGSVVAVGVAGGITAGTVVAAQNYNQTH